MTLCDFWVLGIFIASFSVWLTSKEYTAEESLTGALLVLCLVYGIFRLGAVLG